MTSDKKEYFHPIEAIRFSQGNYQFFVFKMKAKDLLKIAYTSPRTKKDRKGIQRMLDEKRLREIGEYVQNQRIPNLLPNAIIVNFSEKTIFRDGKIHIYVPPNDSGEAFILDGQHRLYAFLPEYGGNINFDLIVAGFINLKDEESAYLFRTINEKQKKINPSIVYDLIPLLRDDWVEFEDKRSQYLIEILNSDQSSPWYDGISMLGGRERTITQSSFITRLKSLFKKDKIFYNQSEKDDFYFSVVQQSLLFEYFKSIKENYPEAWMNKNYFLCKNTGVAVMINLLDMIIKNMVMKNKKIVDDKGLCIDKNDFNGYLKKIKKFPFDKEKSKLYLGEAGIRELTRELQVMMF